MKHTIVHLEIPVDDVEHAKKFYDARLDLAHGGGLAAMNGLQWFEGYAFHEAFHQQQIADLMALHAELPGI